ncbi:DUF1553 domain-containing protein [Planctomycetaceae bacterium SH139]
MGQLHAEEPIDFSRQILPLLSDRCALCHGPDPTSREAELRLDIAEAVGHATQNGGHALVIAPGDAAASELMRRITSDDVDEQMPPPHANLSLTAAEIELLRRWIDQGAKWEQHWSFRPLVRPQVPEPVAPKPVHDGSADPTTHSLPAGNVIDRFLDARIKAADLPTSPPADRYSLARRLTLDLTGLPPTVEELQRFVNDESPQAYARLVDRLLASPACGQQMAVPWLDAARYADTYGYQSDVYRDVWQWRDWVVDAFNQGMPYDQFLNWQIAGDLVPEANRQSRLATAFNRLHRQTNEGGSVEEEFRVEYVADRVNTLGTAVLGLTLECARCHDHKYDPISQKNYYELAAFFANIDESGLYSHFTSFVPTPVLDLPTEAQQQALRDAAARVEQAAAAYHQVLSQSSQPASLSADSQTADAQLAELRAGLLTDQIAHYDFGQRAEQPVEAAAAKPERIVVNQVADGPAGSLSGGPQSVLRNQFDPALLLDGENGFNTSAGGDWDWWQPFTIALWIKPTEAYQRAVVWHRSKAWTDAASCGYELLIEEGRLSAALIHFWPGDAIRVRAVEALAVDQWSHVTVVWDGSGEAAGLQLLVDGKPIAIEVVRDKLVRTIRGGGANQFTIGNRFRDRGFKQGQVDELRMFTRDLQACEVQFLATGQTPTDVSELVAAHHHATSPAVREQRQALRETRRQLAAARDAIPAIMAMQEESGLHETYILRRGSYDAPEEKIEHANVPESLGQLPAGVPANRLGLARWLTDSRPGHRHPLVARVAVNRLWQQFFERGLVHTAEDFGLQGEPPSHPRLLDYLAVQLIESDWDLKALVREVVMSAAYRRDANCEADARERDPDNRWLARGPASRLPVEAIRDAALAVGGLLARQTGGPPVRPYQPAGLWQEKSGQTYQRQTGAGSHRRSLYTIWKRTSPPPAMMIFDAPGREVCTAQRSVTQTPLQALVLLNDDQFVEAARGVAYRLLQDSQGDVRQDASQLLLSMLGRPASDAEVAAICQLVARQQADFEARPEAAKDYLSIGDFDPFATPAGEQLNAAQLAAWAVAAQTIMNLHEWVNR